ncbi:hypothetical protein TNIN_229261 [Trichonephila inaurata madagascariensis]|uniref:Uncharacterized protein n=1 Tax=Trichonephila inaurata madagascariensis TaxID=2747483 RepID=A0A8X7BZN6_9ARAC|nr:hypothetical protein TNIN_229261 [Trichonephila inaurata madagascariensis]
MHFQTEWKERDFLKKLSSFTLRSNSSEPSDQSSENSSVIPMIQNSKYLFYDYIEKKLIVDNADFEEEEKDLIDIFNSNSTFLHNNTNLNLFENGSYNEACHIYPISTNASLENHTDEERVEENLDDLHHTDKNVDYYTDEDLKENIVDYISYK